MIISLLDQQIVGGRSTKQSVPTSQALGNLVDLVPLHKLNLGVDERIVSARLVRVASQLVYRIKTTPPKHRRMTPIQAQFLRSSNKMQSR